MKQLKEASENLYMQILDSKTKGFSKEDTKDLIFIKNYLIGSINLITTLLSRAQAENRGKGV